MISKECSELGRKPIVYTECKGGESQALEPSDILASSYAESKQRKNRTRRTGSFGTTVLDGETFLERVTGDR
jgi:hypothetical protein